MEVHLPPVDVALRRCAGLERIGRLHVGMWIVAHAAAPAVRVFGRIEVGEQVPHLVTAEALARGGSQQPGG